MKMAKPSERDIDAAGNLMSLLHQIDRGDYPNLDEDADVPDWFDEHNIDHLRAFYDAIKATLDKGPGYPGRVIGGMCYVIMYDKNEIIDPASDTLDLHPKIVKALELADRAPTTSTVSAPAEQAAFDRAEFIRRLILSVAELSDRDSPEDQPEMMLVTDAELRDCATGVFEEMDEESELAAPSSTEGAQKAPDEVRTAAARDVLAERRRQIEVEGWHADHDAEYVDNELSFAAASYATSHNPDILPKTWPWPSKWWKPAGTRRDLVKAGALILADIERIDREALRTSTDQADTDTGSAA